MKYIIFWDIGFGQSQATVEANSREAAVRMAYEASLEDFDCSVDYGCFGEATPELLDEYNLSSL